MIAIRGMQVVETLKDMYEYLMKNNVKLHIQMKNDAFYGKMESICLVLLFMVNM